MARRSSGGRSARPPPRPAGRSPPPRPAARSPPPQTAPRAAAPAPARAQGHFGGFFLQSIADGVGFGAGNAVANRVVDAVMGPRTSQHEVDAAAPSVACTWQSKVFQDCLNCNSSDISKCQIYMDTLVACRRTQVP